MLRVVIVDDEPLAIRAMQRLLAPRADICVVGSAGSAAAAVDIIRATRPDLVFLDIDLGGGNGFDVIAGLDHAPRIIFVTAHARHAVDAFAVEAADYLLKPVLPERLAAALERVERLVAAQAALRTVELRTPNRTIFAPPGAIAALLADGDFTRVHVAGAPPMLILRSLGQFEALLPAPPFQRLGRSVMINLDRVQRIQSRDRNLSHVVVDGLDGMLPLGRVASARLRAALAGR